MALIGSIANGETGLSARNKINLVVGRANTNTGWGSYRDNVYTVGSPLVVNSGVTVAFPNNKAIAIETQLPQGTSTFYNGTRLTPDADGDAYDIRISFSAKSSSNAGSFALSCDIRAAGDGSTTIFTKSASTIRGNNTEQQYSFATNIFTASTFVANGGLLRFESITGNTSIYDISMFVNKVHASR